MLFQIKTYLKFLWHSKNQYAVHSPFVFSLLTKCFYDNRPKPEYSILKKYRKLLLENTNTIEVTDFGAGSKVFKSNTRAISKIAKTAGITRKRAKLLFRLSAYFQPSSVLEIGTSLGLATSALALGNPQAGITSLEGCKETVRIAQDQFDQFGLTNIKVVVTEFQTYLETQSESSARTSEANRNPKTLDLILFDGNHQKQATLDYFELLVASTSNESVWIFDDIHWSPDMEEAWEIIQSHPKVSVTIDTFQWGFVFFRTEQEKEHFIIRL